MEYRYYKKQDYPVIAKWWQSWGWDAIPEIFLSKTGIIVSNEGVDLAVCFLYSTDSAICWIEHFTVNKDAPKEVRNGSVEFLIDTAITEARNRGFIVAMSSVKHEGLIKKLLKAGYNENIESGMTNLTRIL